VGIMMTHKEIFLLAGVLLVIGNIFACASRPSNRKSVCNEITLPNSYKIYLFVSNDYTSQEKIVEALESHTVVPLLQRTQDVKIVKDLEDVGSDGVLLQIDLMRAFLRGVSKRIEIQYQIINNETNEVMIKEKDALESMFGYNNIAIVLGKRISVKVTNLISCFENRGKASS
jgi:hypothetical protein